MERLGLWGYDKPGGAINVLEAGCAGVRSAGKASMKVPVNGVPASSSNSVKGAELSSSPASLGSRLKLNPPNSSFPSVRLCRVRSKSGKGLWPDTEGIKVS